MPLGQTSRMLRIPKGSEKTLRELVEGMARPQRERVWTMVA